MTEPAKVIHGGGRPGKGYFLADGDRVPSVTTVGGWKLNIDGLLIWANRGGLDGKTLNELRDAANIGKLVHSLIEAELTWTDAPDIPEELNERVQTAFTAWTEWFDGVKTEIVATELPLVSEEHRYGGTLDCVFRDRKGRLALADWKSTSDIYSSNLVQVAAYGMLWNETQEEALSGGFHIVQISRDYGTFSHHYYPDLSMAWEQFLAFLAAYEREKTLKKMAK